LDKETKRQLRKAVRAKERAAARASFPLPPAELRNLFDWLNEELGSQSCDRSLRLTRVWIDGRCHDASTILPWLEDNGGFCDCEVLANVEQQVEDALHDT
jgi:hypothetical protein